MTEIYVAHLHNITKKNSRVYLTFITDVPSRKKIEFVYFNTKKDLLQMAIICGCEYEFMMDNDEAGVDYFFDKSVVFIIENDNVKGCPLRLFASHNFKTDDKPFSFECVQKEVTE